MKIIIDIHVGYNFKMCIPNAFLSNLFKSFTQDKIYFIQKDFKLEHFSRFIQTSRSVI